MLKHIKFPWLKVRDKALVHSTISQIDNLATNFTENRISDHSTGKIIFISNFFILLHLCVSPFFVPWSFSTIHLFITINLQFSFVMYNNNVDSINAKTNRAMANVRTKKGQQHVTQISHTVHWKAGETVYHAAFSNIYYTQVTFRINCCRFRFR